MGLGKVPLVWGGLDLIDGQCGEELPVATERILVGGKNGSAICPDRLRQFCECGGRGAGPDCIGRKSTRARLGGGLFLTAWLPSALTSRFRGLGLGHASLLRALLSTGCVPL